MAFGELIVITHIEQEGIGRQRIPLRKRQIAAQMIRRDEARVVQRILRRAKLRRVAQFRFFEVKHRAVFLNERRYHIDLPRDIDSADGLHTEDAAIWFRKQQLEVKRLRAGVVTDVVLRMQIHFFVIGDARALQRLLRGTSLSHREIKKPANRRALHAAEGAVAPGDDIGRDAALPVRRSSQREENVRVRDDIMHLHRIADG